MKELFNLFEKAAEQEPEGALRQQLGWVLGAIAAHAARAQRRKLNLIARVRLEAQEAARAAASGTEAAINRAQGRLDYLERLVAQHDWVDQVAAEAARLYQEVTGEAFVLSPASDPGKVAGNAAEGAEFLARRADELTKGLKLPKVS